jgi:hypothetical protein
MLGLFCSALVIFRIKEFARHMFCTGLLRPGEFKGFIRGHMGRDTLT